MKRLAYKMSNVCFFELFKLQNFQKPSLLSEVVLSRFSPSGRLTKCAMFVFSSVRAFKSPNFCQKRSLKTFSRSRRLIKLSKFGFLSFSNFKAFKSPRLFKKTFLSTVSPNRRQYVALAHILKNSLKVNIVNSFVESTHCCFRIKKMKKRKGAKCDIEFFQRT